jgi:hypothetical protein
MQIRPTSAIAAIPPKTPPKNIAKKLGLSFLPPYLELPNFLFAIDITKEIKIKVR